MGSTVEVEPVGAGLADGLGVGKAGGTRLLSRHAPTTNPPTAIAPATSSVKTTQPSATWVPAIRGATLGWLTLRATTLEERSLAIEIASGAAFYLAGHSSGMRTASSDANRDRRSSMVVTQELAQPLAAATEIGAYGEAVRAQPIGNVPNGQVCEVEEHENGSLSVRQLLERGD